MLLRYACLLSFSALSLASCQSIKSAAVPVPQAEFTTIDATDSTEAVVLMHSSQGPEAIRTTVSMTEARAMSAERVNRAER